MEPRRIKMHYEQVSLTELIGWLKANRIKHKLIPNEPGKDDLGNLVFFIEVYNAKHETAIRLKWKTL